MNDRTLIRVTFGVIILLTFTLTYLLLPPVNTTRPTSTVLTAQIGERVAHSGVALTVHAVRNDAVGAGPLVPRPENRFVVVDLTIENLASTTLDIAPILNFYLKDREGWVTNSTAVPSMHAMLSGGILPGDILREEIGFEVSRTASSLRLYFEPGRIGEETIVVDLGI